MAKKREEDENIELLLEDLKKPSSNKKTEPQSIEARCVMGYPQPTSDQDKPRLAYWKCDKQVRKCCSSKPMFVGCGRNLCDPHAKKYTYFQKALKHDKEEMREFFQNVVCYECDKNF